VDGQGLAHVVEVNEAVHLAVRVAGDVHQGGPPGRGLQEAGEGHHGEELVDGPGVGEALKDGEVADQLVGEELLQVFQLVGDIGEVLGDGLDPAGDVVEDLLR